MGHQCKKNHNNEYYTFPQILIPVMWRPLEGQATTTIRALCHCLWADHSLLDAEYHFDRLPEVRLGCSIVE